MTFRREDQGAETILHISGELDALTAPDLRSVLEELVGEKRKRIIVELEHLDLIDSSGVAAIVALFKRSRGHGGRVSVRNARDQPLAVFKLLRMDRVFFELGGAQPRA